MPPSSPANGTWATKDSGRKTTDSTSTRVDGAPALPTGGYYAPWINPKLPSGPRGQSLTDRLASETISFIEQHREKPFLAYLAPYAVHGPIQTTKPLWTKYREKAARQPAPGERFKIDRTLPVRQVQDNPIYAGLIEETDTAIGRVLTRLRELGLDKKTIVVFTGDNGGVVSGDSYSSCMFPYRGGKGRQWEGGLRVPFYIKVPGVTQPGSTCATPVIHIDFYPTLLALAGIQESPTASRWTASVCCRFSRAARSATGHFSGTIPTMATRAANPPRSSARMAGN